jgi:hypothetical protein
MPAYDRENLDPEESARQARAIQAMERSRAKTPAGYARMFNKVAREWGLGPPTRAEQRAVRTDIRNQEAKLRPEQVDRNAYRHPVGRERCPRDMPARRPAGWTAIHFVLPKRTIEGLTLLTKYVAAQEQAGRSGELHGFRRRYLKTKNYFVVQALKLLA